MANIALLRLECNILQSLICLHRLLETLGDSWNGLPLDDVLETGAVDRGHSNDWIEASDNVSTLSPHRQTVNALVHQANNSESSASEWAA